MKSLLLIVLLSCPIVQADSLTHMTALQGVDYMPLKSAVNGHQYHIYVQSPAPQAGDLQRYPVVYLLDGGNLFPMLAPYHHYLQTTEELSPVILVGISYGTTDWKKGNRRSTDFTLPADDRAHYGGAAAFHQMMTDELFPLIEQKYPTDSSRRILMGHSIGGQFALYAAQHQPHTFAGLIASNPAIHRNTAQFLQDSEPTSAQPKLFIMQADGDDERFKKPRKTWLEHWQRNPHHWIMKVMTVEGHHHMSSVPAAYRQGMLWLNNIFSQNTETQ